MKFQDLNQIKKEFNFTDDEPKEIQKKLRDILAKLHPDKNGGKRFASKEDEEKFLKANEADQFLEKFISERNAIVPTNETTELIKLVRDLVVVNEKEDKIAKSESRLSERIQNELSQLGKQYLAPRLTVSAITTVLTFAWLLPGTISEHPILKSLININDPRFTLVWIMSMLLTAFVLYGTSISEARQKEFQSKLMTEIFQNDAFERFLRSGSSSKITKAKFIEFLNGDTWFSKNRRIYSGILPWQVLLRQLMGRPLLIIDLETAQLIADLVFERAERSGIIQKDNTSKRLDQVYVISEEEEDDDDDDENVDD